MRKPSRDPPVRSAVGWNCMNSRSARRAPAASARPSPAPTAPAGLVVRSQRAAMPPVASTVARASSGSSAPSRRRASRPMQRPSCVHSATAAAGSSTWIRSCVAARADSSRVIRRPVAEPPACTIRRTEWPPSSPSARFAVAVGVEGHAERLELVHPRRRLLAEHPHGALPGGLAPGRERVRGVQLGRVALGQRRGDPALRPEARGLGQRRATHQRHARPQVGRHQGGEQPRRAGADDRHVGAKERFGRVLHGRVGTVPARVPILFSHPSSLEHDTGFGHPERPRAHPGDRARAGGAGLARLRARARRPPRRDGAAARGASARARGGGARAERPRRRVRPRHAAQPGLLGGGAARRRRRLRARGVPARRGRARRASRRCARPGTTPSRRGRWASACSRTCRSPRATRSTRSGPSGCWCSTGTCTTATAPTRSSTRRREVLFASIHQYPFYPGTGPLEDVGSGPGEGYSINLPVPGGSGEDGVLLAGRARGAAGRAALRARPRAALRRLRRAPRRPGGRLHARDLLIRRADPAGAHARRARWARCWRAVTTSMRWRSPPRPRWRRWRPAASRPRTRSSP